jgi:hypothetical protein
MARRSLELGCPQSQGFVDAEQEGHLPNAKRSFRRVHRDHADAHLPPLAICTGLTNANTRSVSSRMVLVVNCGDSPYGRTCSNGVNVFKVGWVMCTGHWKFTWKLSRQAPSFLVGNLPGNLSRQARFLFSGHAPEAFLVWHNLKLSLSIKAHC